MADARETNESRDGNVVGAGGGEAMGRRGRETAPQAGEETAPQPMETAAQRAEEAATRKEVASTDDGAARDVVDRGGRPRVLDAVKRGEICAMLAAGCSYRTAARYACCTPAAISMLMKRDESFREQVNRALAQREAIPLSHIRQSSKQSWRAAAWLLERTVKETYGPDDRSDPTDLERLVEKDAVEEAVAKAAARMAAQAEERWRKMKADGADGRAGEEAG